jgi:hypothetical protein
MQGFLNLISIVVLCVALYWVGTNIDLIKVNDEGAFQVEVCLEGPCRDVDTHEKITIEEYIKIQLDSFNEKKSNTEEGE